MKPSKSISNLLLDHNAYYMYCFIYITYQYHLLLRYIKNKVTRHI